MARAGTITEYVERRLERGEQAWDFWKEVMEAFPYHSAGWNTVRGIERRWLKRRAQTEKE